MAVVTFKSATGSNASGFVIRPEDGWWWNVTAIDFAVYDAGDISTYGIAATQYGATGIFRFTFPVGIAAGIYSVGACSRAGATLTEADIATGFVAGAFVDWDGVSVLTFAALPPETAGRPTTLPGLIRRSVEWAINLRHRDRVTGVVTLRNELDTATLEQQTQSTTGSVDTQTKGV